MKAFGATRIEATEDMAAILLAISGRRRIMRGGVVVNKTARDEYEVGLHTIRTPCDVLPCVRVRQGPDASGGRFVDPTTTKL
jgi:hypothetical protein